MLMEVQSKDEVEAGTSSRSREDQRWHCLARVTETEEPIPIFKGHSQIFPNTPEPQEAGRHSFCRNSKKKRESLGETEGLFPGCGKHKLHRSSTSLWEEEELLSMEPEGPDYSMKRSQVTQSSID